MPHAVVLSHTGIAHELGHLEPWFDRHGFTLTRVYREDGPTFPAADLLVCMGSPTSAAAGHCAAPATQEIEAIRAWVTSGRPYLGLCFGAQALAAATGGAVRRMDVPYQGYVEMDLMPEAPRALDGPWLTWHEDGLTAPTDSTLLGSRDHADLAFRTHRAWGLQPHIEVTPDIAERMLVGLGVPEIQYSLILHVMRGYADRDAARAAALLDAFLDDVG